MLIASLLYLSSYWVLLAVVAAVGLAGQLCRPAAATLLSDLTSEDRQIMIFAMQRFGLNLGAMAAPLIGFALYNLDDGQYDLLFWGEALAALAYAVLAWIALPAREPRLTDKAVKARAAPEGGYLAVFRDRRYVLYLVAMFVHTMVYVQYLSTLPLDVNAAGLEVFWYTVAVSLNGFIVIAFELLLTKVTQHWPFKVTIGLAFGLLGAGVAFYALPIGPAVIVIGTLIWTLGEIIGGPSIFAYPAIAGQPHVKGRYIGSFQFVFGLSAAIGPVVGGWLFVRLGHQVWLVLAVGSLIATTLGLAAVRTPARSSDTAVGAEPPSPAAAPSHAHAPSRVFAACLCGVPQAGIRSVAHHGLDESPGSNGRLPAAVASVPDQLGVDSAASGNGVKPAELHPARVSETSTDDEQRIAELERENAELRSMNELLKAAVGFPRAGPRPAPARTIRFVDQQRHGG
jgi:MFS family permease